MGYNDGYSLPIRRIKRAITVTMVTVLVPELFKVFACRFTKVISPESLDQKKFIPGIVGTGHCNWHL